MTVNFALVLYEQACVCIAYCVQPNLWKRLLPHEKHRHRQNHFNCCIYFQNQANICKGKGKKCLRQKEKTLFYFAILHWRKQMAGHKNMCIDMRYICICIFHLQNDIRVKWCIIYQNIFLIFISTFGQEK